MSKIAIISDIHGNLEALKKVFEDINSRNIEQIICLGDLIAKGHHPNECIELVKDKCHIVLRGNTDRYFTEDHENIENYSLIEQKRIKWNKELLNEVNYEYLKNLPMTHEFYMSGSLIRLFHATPWSDDVSISNLDTIKDKSKMFDPTEYTSDKIADIIIYGHLHHQYMDKLYNKTIINIGSVGNTFDLIRDNKFDSSVKETTNAHYLIIEGNYGSQKYGDDLNLNFIRIPYDIDKELEDSYKNLEPEGFENIIKNGVYQDAWKLDAWFKQRNIILRDSK